MMKRSTTTRVFAFASAFLTGVFASAASFAAEEIVVTARKRAETVRDVPATVTVFGTERIERSDIDTASEIALLTPGVSLVDAAEVGDTQVNIRGLNGARDAENSYALVIDGITYTNPAALNRQYSNLEQIEILKGPQGAIYGRNASAGAIIINTGMPGEEFGGVINASYGEDETASLVAEINGPLGQYLSGSLQGEYFTTDGFYENEFLNRDDITDNKETWAVTGRLIFEPDDRTTVDAKLRFGEVDASSITFNSVFHLPDVADAFMNPFWYENVNDHDFRFYSNIVHNNDQETVEWSVKLDREYDGFDLTAWSLFSDIENQLGADGTSAAFAFFAAEPACEATAMALGTAGANFPLNPPQFIGMNGNSVFFDMDGSLLGAYTPTACDGTQFQRRNQKDWSFEVRLTSNTDDPFQWMGGIYFLTIDREVAVSTGIDRLNAPGYRGARIIQAPFTMNPVNPTEQLVWDQFDTKVYSVFGQLAYDFSDRLTGDLAVRYDREERDVRSLVPGPDIASPLYINPCELGVAPTDGVTPINPGLCDGPIAPKSKTFDQFQPKVSLKFDWTDNTTLFTSYGVGFRSGGFNNQGSQATVNTFINDNPFINGGAGLCDPAVPGCIASGRSRVGINDDYREETTQAFEAGFKSELYDSALRLEGAVYVTDVEDMQFFEFLVGPFGLLRVVENIDEVSIQGIELGATWDATEWLDLYAGANFVDSEIDKNNARPDTIGNESPYTPEYTANVGGTVEFAVDDGLNFFANVDVSTIGDTWFHVVQNQRRLTGFDFEGEYSVAQRDSYTLVNLRTGIEGDNWTAAVWIDNLTDEDYLEEVIPAPEFGGSFIHAASQRRAGVDFTWRF